METQYLAYALALLLMVALGLFATMLRGRWKTSNDNRVHDDADQADMAETRRELLRQSRDY